MSFHVMTFTQVAGHIICQYAWYPRHMVYKRPADKSWANAEYTVSHVNYPKLYQDSAQLPGPMFSIRFVLKSIRFCGWENVIPH